MNLGARFGQAHSVAVTVLVDNHTDMLVESTAAVKRFADQPLLAEHGLAVLLDLGDGATRILWDAGVTPIALLEKMRRMEVDPATVQRIALSHGHDDHTTALTGVLRALRPAVVAPSHCTGFATIQRFAAAMPGSFVQGLVGTTYLFYTQGL